MAWSGNTTYNNSIAWLSLFFTISAGSIVILWFAFRTQEKSFFQKNILRGAVFFYILVLLANLQSSKSMDGLLSGIAFIFPAFIVEHLFFAVASASRIKYLYRQAEQLTQSKEIELLNLRATSYQYQLEIEKVINFFAAAMATHYSLSELLWDMARNLIGKLGFEDCMIYLWNDDKTMLLQKAGYGIKGSMQEKLDKDVYHVAKGKGIVGATVDGKQALLINDTSVDSRYFSADGKIRLSELCVPILLNNEAIGAINTEHSEKNYYTERHLQILTTIASMLAEKIDTLQAHQQTREKEIAMLQMSKDLATSQLTALRSQMNPHFLFNAMNSIQQFTLLGNMEKANLYLSKFSSLLRKVLHSSGSNAITVEEEIEILKLYLDIEQLRLGETFSYKIIIAEDIETDACKIPAMLIQPFVENAVKHGLTLKENEKKLNIEFLLKDENHLSVIITDNGIGRAKAALIKEKQQKFLPHESKGIQMIKDRLQLLSHTVNDDTFMMEDLVEDGAPAGTKIRLIIPLITYPGTI